MNPNAWIHPFARQTVAKTNLVCFPFAGGGAGAFRSLAASAPDEIAVYALQLPGRENRHGEAFVNSVGAVIQGMRAELLRLPPRPTVFFGYSMGAVIAYETAFALRYTLPIAGLVVGAKGAPHVATDRNSLHLLDDVQLTDRVRKLGGTPDAVLESRELMEFFLPRLRADFEINESYVWQDRPLLDIPLLAMGAREDRMALPERVLRWPELAREGEARLYDGRHFFFFETPEAQDLLFKTVLDVAHIAQQVG